MVEIRLKKIAKNGLRYLVLRSLFVCLPVAATAADDERVMRFLYSSSGEAELAHWNDEIVLAVSGAVTSNVAIEAVSQVAFWAKITRSSVHVQQSLSGFMSDEAKGAVNYVIHFDSGVEPGGRLKLSEVLPQERIDTFTGELTSLSKIELSEASKGCFVGRFDRENNETAAVAILIDTALNPGDRNTCLDYAVIGSFGLIPNVYLREFTLGSTSKTIVVTDYSEGAAALASSAACVKDGGETNPQCAASIAGRILKND